MKRKENNSEYEKNLENLTKFMDEKYPGWENQSNAKQIKKRLEQTAKKMCKNKLLKKTKVLYKKDFPDWPFYVDKIILIQTSKLWISCIIENREYALNGLAASALKLEFPHDCGKAIPGKSMTEFIKIGSKL